MSVLNSSLRWLFNMPEKISSNSSSGGRGLSGTPTSLATVYSRQIHSSRRRMSHRELAHLQCSLEAGRYSGSRTSSVMPSQNSRMPNCRGSRRRSRGSRPPRSSYGCRSWRWRSATRAWSRRLRTRYASGKSLSPQGRSLCMNSEIS